MLTSGRSSRCTPGSGGELIAGLAARRCDPTGPFSRSARLQDFRRVVGETRTLAARERDVAAVRPALEAIDDIGQAGAALGQVRRVDLRDIAQADDLGAGPGPGDQRLHL